MKTQKIAMIPALAAALAALCACSTNEVPVNYALSAPLYGTTHFDSAQTDSIPYSIKAGSYYFNLAKEPKVWGGPVNIMTLASTDKDYMWGVSSQGITYISVKDRGFEEAGRINLMKEITPAMHDKVLHKDYKDAEEVEAAVKDIYGLNYFRIFNGIYSVVDSDNVVYANYNGNKIYAVALADEKDPSKGLRQLNMFDASAILGKGEILTGVGMTYDGMLVIGGSRTIAITDRQFKGHVHVIHFGKDERVTNSMAIDEDGGIYVASDTTMYKLVWTGKKLSDKEADGAWKSPYTFGEEPPAVKVGKGTGATPTLMGFGPDPDKLVVITDGANRMNLVAFWRNEIPADFYQKPGTLSRRIADQIPVTCGLPATAKWVQTEQSVVVKGYGAFVINNIVEKSPKDRLAGVIALGPVVEPPHGAERFEWDSAQRKFRSVWTNPEVVSISMVPVVSAPSNTVLANGYYKGSGWEVRGFDWNTGKMVHRSIFGKDNYGNGAYALIQLFENGDMLFNSISGPYRLKY